MGRDSVLSTVTRTGDERSSCNAGGENRQGSLPWVKRPERKADQSLHLSAEVKNQWSYTSTPTIRLNGDERGSSTLSEGIFALPLQIFFGTYRTGGWMAAEDKRRQDRQCTYNVTLKRVRVTTVAVQKQQKLYIVSVCSLRYPACNAHAPYCHL